MNRNVGPRANALLKPLLDAADGLLGTGYYGDILQPETKPDIVAYVGMAGAALISLYPTHKGAGEFLRDYYAANGQPERVREICILNLRQPGWDVVSIPIWRQVTIDAAAQGLLIEAHEDLVDALVASGMRREMAEWRAGVRSEPPEPDWDAMAASLDEIVPGMGEIIPEIRSDLEQITSHPDGPAAGLREVMERRNISRADARPGTAAERFGDVNARLGTDEALRELRGAGAVQDQMEHELTRLFDLEDEYQGCIMDEPAPHRAHIHAQVSWDDGLVYLHATPVDNYLGVPFISEILMPEDRHREVVPVIEEMEPGRGHAHHGRAVTGITNWPAVVAHAKLLGILIRVSDCPLDKLAEEIAGYPE